MLTTKKTIVSSVLICSILFSGCATSQQMMKLSESSLEERQLQTKIYDTTKESEILSASVSSLQDMGFNIDEISREFGVITCSKTRDAREVGQQVGLFFLALLGGAQAMEMADHTQIIRATVVTTPKTNQNKALTRLTVQRVIKNQRGLVTKVETVKEPEIYKAFFEKLSKAIFLEANDL